MKEANFDQMLSGSTASRTSRMEMAAYVLAHPAIFTDLVLAALNPSISNHHKACWVMELVLEKNIMMILPHLDRFCREIGNLSNESAIRSMSKISLFLAKKHCAVVQIDIKLLSDRNQILLNDVCFDWLINDVKVATKVYAMRALFEFGVSEKEIWHQLTAILEKDFEYHSPAYRSASKNLIHKMSKQNFLEPGI